MFNSLDKSLLDRTIRILLQSSSDLKTSSTLNGAWPNTAEGRKDKRLCDSYARDARDLKNLAQRMINEVGDASVAKYCKAIKVKPAAVPNDWRTAGSAPLVGESPKSDLQKMASGSPVVFQNQRQVDWQSDAHAAGLEMEEFEQGPRHPPGDLTDQAALVVGENG